MQTSINYADYINDTTGNSVISSIEAKISNQTKLQLSIKSDALTSVKTLNVKMEDLIGVNEINDDITKSELKELIQMLKLIYSNL